MFDARQTVSVRGIGDFANRIQTVFVDLDYNDTTNGYAQTRSIALTGASPFFDWTIPVINEKAGKVTYKATIAYKDGTTRHHPADAGDHATPSCCRRPSRHSSTSRSSPT